MNVYRDVSYDRMYVGMPVTIEYLYGCQLQLYVYGYVSCSFEIHRDVNYSCMDVSYSFIFIGMSVTVCI